jgi:hypothetical protein
MKSFLVAVALILCASTLYAQTPYCVSTGLKTADAILYTGAVDLCGVEVVTNGSADATCIVYGALAATAGTELFKGVVVATGNFGGVTFDVPVRNDKGLYLDINGTGAACIIYYYPR